MRTANMIYKTLLEQFYLRVSLNSCLIFVSQGLTGNSSRRSYSAKPHRYDFGFHEISALFFCLLISQHFLYTWKIIPMGINRWKKCELYFSDAISSII